MLAASETSNSPEQNRPEQDFVESAYLFLTFLYGTAVHLVIAEAHDASAKNIAFQFLVLCLILFLFSDWASRTRLPRLLPEKPPGYLYVTKSFLEVVCIFFLVTAFLRIVDQAPHQLEDRESSFTLPLAFGCFLVATALWDWLMIYIMKAFQAKPLAKHVWITGRAIDMEETRKRYLGKFEAWKLLRTEEIKESARRIADEIEGDPAHSSFRMITGGLKGSVASWSVAIFEGTLASVAQFLANHVLHANAVAGLSLVIGTWLERTPLDALIGLWWTMQPLYDLVQLPPLVSMLLTLVSFLACALVIRQKIDSLVALLAAVGLLAFVLGFQLPGRWMTLSGLVSAVFLLSTGIYAFRNTGKRRLANRLGGWVIAVSSLMLYTSLPSYLLIVLLAMQQVLANAFLQFAVKKPTNSEGDFNHAGQLQTPLASTAAFTST